MNHEELQNKLRSNLTNVNTAENLRAIKIKNAIIESLPNSATFWKQENK
jgi:hypothetical protein